MTLRQITERAIEDNAITTAKIATNAIQSYHLSSNINLGGGNVTVSTNAPSPNTSTVGNFWVSSTTGRQYILVEDQDSKQWVEVGNPSAGQPFFSNVRAINGLTGNVTIDTSYIPESGNLYYTNTRAFANLLSATTSSLTEGSNLYFTNSRAISALTGNNINIAANGLLTANVVQGGVTSVGGSTGAVSNVVLLSSISGIANSNTAYLSVPNGTFSQRMAAPNGALRFNTSNNTLETYIDGSWTTIASGGYNVEILAVAGGGGAGGGTAGGAGAGGLIYYGSETPKSPNGSAFLITRGSNVVIVVGAGGSGTDNTSPSQPGSNTTITVNGTTYTAVGGGAGGHVHSPTPYTRNATVGGSGGGGSAYGGVSASSASGIAGQGNPGGAAGPDINPGGGGGGAGGSGVAAASGGTGGAGLSYAISGSPTFYAGGGGGSASGAGGPGGSGGGGSGGGAAGTPGTPYTGGGGGGGWDYSAGNGGSGGSGVVIIRYLGAQVGTGGNVTTSGGYTVHTFTGSGTFTG